MIRRLQNFTAPLCRRLDCGGSRRSKETLIHCVVDRSSIPRKFPISDPEPVSPLLGIGMLHTYASGAAHPGLLRGDPNHQERVARMLLFDELRSSIHLAAEQRAACRCNRGKVHEPCAEGLAVRRNCLGVE